MDERDIECLQHKQLRPKTDIRVYCQDAQPEGLVLPLTVP